MLTCQLRVEDVHPGDPHLFFSLTGAVTIFAGLGVGRAQVLIATGNELGNRAQIPDHKIGKRQQLSNKYL